jgi:hypothetical protein
MSSEKLVSNFFKRCYEIGKTPIWEPEIVGTKSPRKRNDRRKYARKTQRSSQLAPGKFYLEGIVAGGANHGFSISGEMFQVNANTFIVGEISLGAYAKVQGKFVDGNKKIATKVIIGNRSH